MGQTKVMPETTPLVSLRPEVSRQVEQLFGDESKKSVYVSTPITTGHEFFRLSRVGLGHVAIADRERLRRANTEHAVKIVKRVRNHFPDSRVIDPLSCLEEPKNWNQDDFNGFWMRVIESYVNLHVLVDGWEYSTGCTWELSQSVSDGIPTLDEHLKPLGKKAINERLQVASLSVDQASWRMAKDAVVRLFAEGRGAQWSL